jgi:hypothetical protein
MTSIKFAKDFAKLQLAKYLPTYKFSMTVKGSVITVHMSGEYTKDVYEIWNILHSIEELENNNVEFRLLPRKVDA